MQSTLIGSLGLGFVWGWLLILVGGGSKRPWRSGSSLTLVTILVALLLFWLFDWRPVLVFAAAAAVSFSTHLAWRRSLIQAQSED